MTRHALVAPVLLVAALGTGCGGGSSGGSSSGPQTVLNLTNRAAVVAGCANVQTAQTDHAAGDDESAAAALRAAVDAFRKPPADPASVSVATTIDAGLAAGQTGSALTAGSSFCAAHGVR